MHMRIFIGIKLDSVAADRIEKFLKPFKKIASPVRWVKTKNIHLTLKFIGDVSEETYANIEKALVETDFRDTSGGPLGLKLEGCGKFGPRESISIFWIGLADNLRLKAIYEGIESALENVGIPRDERSFKPHITVGRNKKRFNFKPFFELIEENGDGFVAEMKATHFQLFKSKLTPDGPIYTVLKEIPIAQA
jgi:RNA 2',3'-cyclic 3'-phosphodiesterase